MKKILFAFVAICTSLNANALDQVTGQVVDIEVTYTPGLTLFKLDTGSTLCPAGTFIQWANADATNNKNIYAALLLSLSSGKKVRVYINDGDTTCTAKYFHLIV